MRFASNEMSNRPNTPPDIRGNNSRSLPSFKFRMNIPPPGRHELFMNSV